MPELSSEAQLVVLYGLLQIILKLIEYFRGHTQDDARADETAANERQQWMDMQRLMLTTVLTDQHNKYAGFVSDIQQRFDDVVGRVQTNFNTALEALVEQITIQMTPVTQQREQKLEAIHADVRIVPNEVWRLGDPKLEGLSLGIRAGLEPLIADLQDALETGFMRIEAGLSERLEALGDEVSPALRGMLSQELAQYQQRTQRQLENIRMLVEALREDLARDGCEDRESSLPGVSFETPGQAASESATPSDFKSKQDNAEQEKPS